MKKFFTEWRLRRIKKRETQEAKLWEEVARWPSFLQTVFDWSYGFAPVFGAISFVLFPQGGWVAAIGWIPLVLTAGATFVCLIIGPIFSKSNLEGETKES